jgi:hypothetical protein
MNSLGSQLTKQADKWFLLKLVFSLCGYSAKLSCTHFFSF